MARKTKGEIELAVSTLEELFKSRQILSYSEADLAKLVGMTEKTVRKHLNELKGEVGSRTIENITQTFIDDLDMMMTDIRYYWKEAKKEHDEKQIMYYTDKLFKAWERFADLLERFGIKEKVADKVNLTGEVKTVSINISMDLKDVKGVKELEDRRVIDV